MSELLQRAAERVQDSMDEILTNFKGEAKITVLVRTPGKPTADFCMTSDDLDEVIAMVQRRKGEAPPQPNVVGMSRELIGLIVDKVFGGAIEDASVIEEIYSVIKRYEGARQPHKLPLTCQCANSKTDPCIVCGKGKTLVTAEWLQKMAAREGDLDCTTGSPSQDAVPCPCTLIEQDESCPVGYPSLLCGICNGVSTTTTEQVTALACEMIKIASDVGEAEDPFAAWETIDLIQSQHGQLRKVVEELKFANIASDMTIKDRADQAARLILAATEGSADA